MCGIYGAVDFSGQPIESEYLSILDRCMLHRGPDDSGILRDGAIAVGMRRLSIIDLAGGHQPIANETGDIHLVLNGEIYNFRELRELLEAQGHCFRTNCDVEVIIHLYEQYGTSGLKHVNGMFAFALYDQTKRFVWLARDRLGIKPLFYHSTGRRVVFSSELNGIAQLTEAPIASEALVSYLGYSYFRAPLTPYQGVKRLHPGEELLIQDGRVTARRYWSLDAIGTCQPEPRSAREELHRLLDEAVGLQMVSDVPLGVFLSGGVDSSAVAALAAKHTSEALRTFTIDFVDKGGHDAPHAAAMAQRLGADHTVIEVTAKEQQKTFEDLIMLMDEPMSDTAIVPTYIVSRRARELGVKVLLSGAGGDELFGGYPRHFATKVLSPAWFAQLPTHIRRPVVAALGLRNSGWSIRLQNAARDFAAQISGINYTFLQQALVQGHLYRELVERIETAFASAARRGVYPRMLLDVQDYLPNNVLSLTDKGTMLASVEGRVPLLDHRLVEFAFSLSEEINLIDGEPKGLFRASLKSVVPIEILRRQKEGFNAPIVPWVERHVSTLKVELGANLRSELATLLDPSVLSKWLSNPTLRRQASSTLYAIYVLNRWLRCRSAAVDARASTTCASWIS